MWCRFKQCLGTFTMLLVEGFSEKNFLGIYLSTFSEFVISEIQYLWGWSFVPKRSKFEIHFKNSAKNSEKVFCFSDNCIWIVIVKWSLWRRRYISSAFNVLTNSPKIWHVNKRNFSNSIYFAVMDEYDQGADMLISIVLRHIYHVAFQRDLLNRTF